MATQSNVIPFPFKADKADERREAMYHDWFDFLIQAVVTPVYPPKCIDQSGVYYNHQHCDQGWLYPHTDGRPVL